MFLLYELSIDTCLRVGALYRVPLSFFWLSHILVYVFFLCPSLDKLTHVVVCILSLHINVQC